MEMTEYTRNLFSGRIYFNIFHILKRKCASYYSNVIFKLINQSKLVYFQEWPLNPEDEDKSEDYREIGEDLGVHHYWPVRVSHPWLGKERILLFPLILLPLHTV